MERGNTQQQQQTLCAGGETKRKEICYALQYTLIYVLYCVLKLSAHMVVFIVVLFFSFRRKKSRSLFSIVYADTEHTTHNLCSAGRY